MLHLSLENIYLDSVMMPFLFGKYASKPLIYAAPYYKI